MIEFRKLRITTQQGMDLVSRLPIASVVVFLIFFMLIGFAGSKFAGGLFVGVYGGYSFYRIPRYLVLSQSVEEDLYQSVFSKPERWLDLFLLIWALAFIFGAFSMNNQVECIAAGLPAVVATIFEFVQFRQLKKSLISNDE